MKKIYFIFVLFYFISFDCKSQSPNRQKHFDEERPNIEDYYEKQPKKTVGNDTLITQKLPKDIRLHSKEGLVFDYNTIKSLLDSGKVIAIKTFSNPTTSELSRTFNAHMDKNPKNDTIGLKDLIVINILLDKPKKEKNPYKMKNPPMSLEDWIKENKRKNFYHVILAEPNNVFASKDKNVKDICYNMVNYFPTLSIISDDKIKQYMFGIIDFEPVFYYEIERAKKKYLKK